MVWCRGSVRFVRNPHRNLLSGVYLRVARWAAVVGAQWKMWFLLPLGASICSLCLPCQTQPPAHLSSVAQLRGCGSPAPSLFVVVRESPSKYHKRGIFRGHLVGSGSRCQWSGRLEVGGLISRAHSKSVYAVGMAKYPSSMFAVGPLVMFGRLEWRLRVGEGRPCYGLMRLSRQRLPDGPAN